MVIDNIVLQLQNVSKTFVQGKQRLDIIQNTSLEIFRQEIVSLVGPSGSGKTTLLQIAGLLDFPDEGQVIINNINTTKTNESERTKLRRHHIGFVYQFHHLLPEFSALENVMLPLLIQKIPRQQAHRKAEDALRTVGLEERLTHRPAALSGGEQQRVAIARAVVGTPSLILADEPTGNLDPTNSIKVFNLLLETIKSYNLAALIVTHDENLARKTEKVFMLQNGKVVKK